jgi:hypothetical protein
MTCNDNQRTPELSAVPVTNARNTLRQLIEMNVKSEPLVQGDPRAAETLGFGPAPI